MFPPKISRGIFLDLEATEDVLIEAFDAPAPDIMKSEIRIF